MCPCSHTDVHVHMHECTCVHTHACTQVHEFRMNRSSSQHSHNSYNNGYLVYSPSYLVLDTGIWCSHQEGRENHPLTWEYCQDLLQHEERRVYELHERTGKAQAHLNTHTYSRAICKKYRSNVTGGRHWLGVKWPELETERTQRP